MTTKEAIQAMLDEKKCKKTFWKDDCYCRFDGNRFIDELGRVLYSFGDSDWEIYEEPKPKRTVVIEKWLFEDKFGIKFVQDIEKDCVLCYCNEFKVTKGKLLDTYEVEL